ncbi:MAG: hypothetical protein PHC45_02995 [Clostridiaceae bacterium]|nr:hypothetical protein [Clostridiaceae bacterium]
MDRKFIKNLRKALVLEAFFSGASSLSKIFDDTDNELKDVMKYADQRFNKKKLPEDAGYKK